MAKIQGVNIAAQLTRAGYTSRPGVLAGLDAYGVQGFTATLAIAPGGNSISLKAPAFLTTNPILAGISRYAGSPVTAIMALRGIRISQVLTDETSAAGLTPSARADIAKSLQLYWTPGSSGTTVANIGISPAFGDYMTPGGVAIPAAAANPVTVGAHAGAFFPIPIGWEVNLQSDTLELKYVNASGKAIPVLIELDAAFADNTGYVSRMELV